MARAIHLVASLVCLAACADFGAVEDNPCTSSLTITPAGDVQVDTEVRATATIVNEFGGVPVVDWRVRFNQTDEVLFSTNGPFEIAFTPHETGTYTVSMDPSASGSSCPSRQQTVNVVMGQPGEDVRLHVTPPPEANVPPIDRYIMLPRGTSMYSMNTVSLESGRVTDGTVGQPAYLKFIPDGQPGAIVETYTDATGAYQARVQSTPHRILVVPTDPAYPPQTIADNLPMVGESYTLSTGVAITGTVLRPNGTPLAGAKVQVFMNDAGGHTVPSTIGTSAANGTFTLRAFAATGANARVVVTPPASSGLPRLEGGSQNFDFTNPITASYSSSLVLRNVNGTTVTRGAALPNAKVTFVGSLPLQSTGTIVAGASAASTGHVRVTVTADGSGVLPTALVPAAELFAVVEPAPGDAAVVELDLTSSVPVSIAAPAMAPFSTTLMYQSMTLEGARLELVPTGALGLAGVGPTVLYASGNGVISGSMASGAIYEARFSDPSRRAAPVGFPSMDAQTIATFPTVQLFDPLTITGTLAVGGGGNPIGGAGVQILCGFGTSAFACDGVERDRPIGETASDVQGSFTIVVAAPGAPI